MNKIVHQSGYLNITLEMVVLLQPNRPSKCYRRTKLTGSKATNKNLRSIRTIRIVLIDFQETTFEGSNEDMQNFSDGSSATSAQSIKQNFPKL
jgi:hypothetical protein